MCISVHSHFKLSIVARPQKRTWGVLISPLRGKGGGFWFLSGPEAIRCHQEVQTVFFCHFPHLFFIHHATRPVGDSEAAAWWHPSDQEGLSSPGGPIYSCGSQNGLPWNHHARLGERRLFFKVKLEPLSWGLFSWEMLLKLISAENFATWNGSLCMNMKTNE